MDVLDINNNEKGKFVTNKTFIQNGLLMTIKNSTSNKLSLQTKQFDFVHLSFNRAGDRFIACDSQGSIYMFDLSYNRFIRIIRLGSTCTALAFNLKCKTEFLVASVDGTLKCFNTETKDLVGWMKANDKSILGLSVHSSGEIFISYSSDSAQLWDLKTFDCKQKLNINSKESFEIVKISFAPISNQIVALFKDDSIYIWSSDATSLKSHLNYNKEVSKDFYNCLSISGDGKLLITGSKNNYFHVWDINKKELIKKIDFHQNPDLVRNIKDCCVLHGSFYENKILVVLTQEGFLEFYNLDNGENLKTSFDNHNENKINQMFCSPNSRYLCCITQNGLVECYDLDYLNIKLNSKNQQQTNGINMKDESYSIKTRSEIVSKKTTENRTMINQAEPKIFKLLKCFHEYPARYRMFIWKIVLKLPENYESYAQLVKKGIHPSFLNLEKKYPLKDQKSIRLLQTTLSALGHWSSILAECDYLPLMIFPFVKLFHNNQVVCFEIIATILINWCRDWFKFFPNPPMNILNMIENVLSYHDKILLEHFIKHRITCVVYGWILLETMFSEIFNKSDWQILFDNVFSNHPGFLIYLVVAYSVCNHNALMLIKDSEDAKHQSSISVKTILNEALKMTKTTPQEIDPYKLINNFEPLPKGTYPIFNNRPNFISDYQKTEKSKILQQEIDYLNTRENQIESHKLNEEKKLDLEYSSKQLNWGLIDKNLRFKIENDANSTQKYINLTNKNLTNKEINVINCASERFSLRQSLLDQDESKNCFEFSLERNGEYKDEAQKELIEKVYELRKKIAKKI